MLDMSQLRCLNSAGPEVGSVQPQIHSAALSNEDIKDRPDRYYIEQVDKDVMQLARTPTVAVFHKGASSPGAPHAFGVFLRQIPALPQLVVSLICRTGMAHSS